MNERPLVTGKGSMYEVSPGVWQIRHSMGKDPVTGKYRYSPKRTIHTKKKREVIAALEAYKAELNNGFYLERRNETVGDYAQRFHDNREGTITPLAYDREALEVRHIQDLFGNLRVQELRPFMIEDAYAYARRSGKYSENEIHKTHVKLKQIMQKAERDELVVKNPCRDVVVKRPEPKVRQSLDAKEAARLRKILIDSEPSAHITAVFLMLDTGIRRGEALGLNWSCVDLDSMEIRIEQQFAKDAAVRKPKSKAGRRTISISEYLVEYLFRWRESQADTLMDDYKLKATEDTPLVHSVRGNKKDKLAEIRYMNPDDFSRWFRKFCVDNGFGSYEEEKMWVDKKGIRRYRRRGYHGLTPHMLRHTQATLLIADNVDLKTVQARLGHASISQTMDIYAHAIAAKDREASHALTDVLDRAEDN